MVRKKTLHEMDDIMATVAAKRYLRGLEEGQTGAIPQDHLWDVMEATRRDPSVLIRLEGGPEHLAKLGAKVIAKVDELKGLDQQG